MGKFFVDEGLRPQTPTNEGFSASEGTPTRRLNYLVHKTIDWIDLPKENAEESNFFFKDRLGFDDEKLALSQKG